MGLELDVAPASGRGTVLKGVPRRNPSNLSSSSSRKRADDFRQSPPDTGPVTHTRPHDRALPYTSSWASWSRSKWTASRRRWPIRQVARPPPPAILDPLLPLPSGSPRGPDAELHAETSNKANRGDQRPTPSRAHAGSMDHLRWPAARRKSAIVAPRNDVGADKVPSKSLGFYGCLLIRLQGVWSPRLVLHSLYALPQSSGTYDRVIGSEYGKAEPHPHPHP
jgi:hypothetical protein